MILGDGIVTVVREVNVAEKGRLPKYEYTEICKSYYAQKTVGMNRYYIAKGQNDNIDMLIRIQHSNDIHPATDKARIDNEYYRITQLQQIIDEDGLPMTELSLERIEDIENDKTDIA